MKTLIKNKIKTLEMTTIVQSFSHMFRDPIPNLNRLRLEDKRYQSLVLKPELSIPTYCIDVRFNVKLASSRSFLHLIQKTEQRTRQYLIVI